MADSLNDFIAGWIGGAAGILVGSPLDVLKARLQAPSHHPDMNSWQTMNNMIQTEGLGSMFKGVLAPVMGLAGLNAILFVSYGGILRYLQPTIDNTTTLPSLAQVYIAGCGAGMACFLFSTPTELIKIKAQMSHTNKSSWQVTKEVFYRNGIKGFYQGGWITLIRDAPSYGIYFWVYEGMKRYLNSDPTQQGEAAAWKYLLAGGLAGTVSWTSIYPIDVIKSRLQMQLIPSSQHQSPSLLIDQPHHHDISRSLQPLQPKPYYTSIKDCVIRSYQSDGIRVFFRGLMPTIIRGFPVNAVTFWVYEVVMVWLSTK